jgi:DNA-3-methyladenine glycosylase II
MSRCADEIKGGVMGLTAAQLRTGIDAIGAIEPRWAAVVASHGYPEPRIRPTGYETLLRTIVGQQVSVKAAAAVWNKLEAACGDLTNPDVITAASFDALRACGLSRQKQGYARSLAELVKSGALDLNSLPKDDQEAIALLTQVKGIGRWSAEIYLLFAEGRPDIWPAGDLAIQIAVGRILGHEERPGEKLTRTLADAWRPHRGAAAILAWHHYNIVAI